MQFIYPEFLFALAAISIPILIHLFNFRRFKKIYFTNVRFLKEIKQDTRSQSKLRRLLILLARILAVTFLVLAFAQPVIPLNKKNIAGGINTISIFVDNSFSMDAVGKNGSLIEVAKKKAREIALAYKPSDHFQLLTNDFEARHQRLVNREEFLNLVDEVKPSASVRNISEIVSRQQDALNNNHDKKSLYLISDFQESVSNLEETKADSSLSVHLVPMNSSEVKNLFVDSCQLGSPYVQLNSTNELTVALKNISNEDAENVPVKLFINDMQRALSSVNIPAHGTAEAKLSFTISQAGWQQAEVSITDYPVTFDDNYFFSFNVKEHQHVLCINGTLPSPYTEALFKNDSFFVLKNFPANQIDYSSFPSNSLIILNGLKDISSGLAQELKKYLGNGGAVFIFPSGELNMESYKLFLQQTGSNYFTGVNDKEEKVSFIEKSHPLFSGVFEKKSAEENPDYPAVMKYYSISKSSATTEEVLMRLRSGETFLSSSGIGKGQLYLSAVPLDETYSNFPTHALFVPVMLRAAMLAKSETPAPLMTGSSEDFVLDDVPISGETILHLINSKKKFDIIPESRTVDNKTIFTTHDQVKESGNYLLASAGKAVSALSFNYDRKESNLACYSENELKSLAEKSGMKTMDVIENTSADLTHLISQLTEGKRLWKYCIMLALVFLFAEVLLIRFLK